MARFYLARVELHEAHPEEKLDYERLHIEMKAAGYGRQISDGTKSFEMPHATYWAGGVEWTPQDAYDRVVAAAKTVAKTYTIIVVESPTRPMWLLFPVKK